MKGLFHYTTKSRLQKILESGKIIPATTGVPLYENPVVWLSFHPYWEPTATKAVLDEKTYEIRLLRGILDMARFDTPVRIEVDPEKFPLTWQDFKRLSGCDQETQRGLHKSAKKVKGNIRDWRISFDNIPKALWLAIEFWQGGQWEPYDS